MNQYEVDKREYQAEWKRRRGTLDGAVEAFNRNHPAKDYHTAILRSMGMDAYGFTSPIAIQQAYRQGMLTLPEARQFLQEQFPDFNPAAGAGR